MPFPIILACPATGHHVTFATDPDQLQPADRALVCVIDAGQIAREDAADLLLLLARELREMQPQAAAAWPKTVTVELAKTRSRTA